MASSSAHLGAERARDHLGHLLREQSVDARELLTGLTTESDEEFLDWLVWYALRITGADFAFVGEVVGVDHDRVCTAAIHTSEGPGEPFEYDLRDTPCSEVLDRDLCLFPKDATALFPKDELLITMGIQSYAGVALHDTGGHPLGLFALLGRQPMDARSQETACAVLESFRARAQAALVHRSARREYRGIQQRLDPTLPQRTLGDLVQGLARTLSVRVAFVSTLADGEGTRAQTKALCIDGELKDNVSYELAGTPSEGLLGRGSVLITHGAREAHPHAPLTQRYGLESCYAVVLCDHEGQAIGHLGILHDRPISSKIQRDPLFNLCAERVAFELQREAAEQQRMETAQQMLEVQRAESLGLLAGGIAHDFNNLLVLILGNTELAQNQVEEGTGARALLDEVLSASTQAADLCKQMLAYAGRARIQSRTFDLRATARDLTKLMRASTPRAIDLDFELGGSALLVNGDRTQVTQVILNLLTNAADAIGAGPGTVRVEVGSCLVGQHDLRELRSGRRLQPGQMAFVRVTDDGCGMDEATCARMFEPFFSTKQKGHGLGLAAMMGIVTAHGGGVRVRSQPGSGSELTVYLPPARLSDTTTDEGGSSFRPSQARRIALVVDDEARVRTVASRILEHANFEVLCAEDGEHALRIYKESARPIDLVILDFAMPKMDGRRTFAALVDLDPGVRVVLSTGYGDAGDLGVVRGRRVDRVVSKPYRMAELIEAANELTAQPRQP